MKGKKYRIKNPSEGVLNFFLEVEKEYKKEAFNAILYVEKTNEVIIIEHYIVFQKELENTYTEISNKHFSEELERLKGY